MSTECKRVFTSEDGAVLVYGYDLLAFGYRHVREFRVCGAHISGRRLVHMSAKRGEERLDIRETTNGHLSVEQDGALPTIHMIECDHTPPLSIEPLPVVYETAYSFITEEGLHVLVIRPTFWTSYEDFKLFVGTYSGQLCEKTVTNVSRLRDGGTTHVTTSAGTLFVPSPLETDVVPSWNGAHCVPYHANVSLKWADGSYTREFAS